jgi:hypothetical protein
MVESLLGTLKAVPRRSTVATVAMRAESKVRPPHLLWGRSGRSLASR